MVCSVSNMEPEKKRERGRDIGKTGATVAENVKRLREMRTNSLRELETKLDNLGVKISASGLQKIEAGTRRVDTDELMALAIALDVNPNVLLLPDENSQNDVSANVTAAPAEVSGETIWDWANGYRVLNNQSPFLTGLSKEGRGVLNRAHEVSQRADDALFETELLMPDEGQEEAEIRRMVFRAYYHARNLQDGEILSLWHVSAEGNAAEAGSLPSTFGNTRLWVEKIKKTIVGIAAKSIEASVTRDDVLRALKDEPNGDD